MNTNARNIWVTASYKSIFLKAKEHNRDFELISSNSRNQSSTKQTQFIIPSYIKQMKWRIVSNSIAKQHTIIVSGLQFCYEKEHPERSFMTMYEIKIPWMKILGNNLTKNEIITDAPQAKSTTSI